MPRPGHTVRNKPASYVPTWRLLSAHMTGEDYRRCSWVSKDHLSGGGEVIDGCIRHLSCAELFSCFYIVPP